MLTVIKKWQISSMFVDVLLKFGDQPQVFQESSGFRQLCQSRDQSFGELSRYPVSWFVGTVLMKLHNRVMLPVHVRRTEWEATATRYLVIQTNGCYA
jgi:hypothetical protein